MGATVLEAIREDLRVSTRMAHATEMVPFGCVTGSELFEDAERFADGFLEHAEELIKHANERGFEKLFAALERLRRTMEAASAVALNAVEERGVHHADGHRSPQAFLQASVNISDRERSDRVHVAGLVKLVPQVGDLLADGRLPVAHAVTLGRLVANERIDRDYLLAALSGFLLFGKDLAHDVFARRVRGWERQADVDGSHRDTEHSHRNRNARLTAILDGFVLEGRFGNIQGAKMAAILQKFVDIEFDRDWQAARRIHGDETGLQHLARTAAQRRADALEALFLAAIGQGDAGDIDIIINIVTDADTFTRAATRAAAATGPAPTDTADGPATTDTADGPATGTAAGKSATDTREPQTPDSDGGPDADAADHVNETADSAGAGDATSEPAEPGEPAGPAPWPFADRRFCHTLDGVDIDPLDAVQAAIDGRIRAVIVGDDGVIVNQGRKQRLFRGNARLAARLQAGIDNLHRCPIPGCRATPRHVDHATEWASADAGRTNVANSTLPCVHHNLWKSKHGYTVRRGTDGNLHTYRPDGTELHPY